MNVPLRLLVLEDNEADYLLALRLLEKDGCKVESRRVDRLAALVEALERELWDAALSDYTLPGLPFREALAAIQDKAPTLPVVLFSGSVGEEEAVSLIRLGVKDFVLKDRPARLPSALQSAIRSARAMRAQMQTLQALAASEARFLATFEQAAVGIAQVAIDGRVLNANTRLCEILGYTREELVGLSNRQLSPPEASVATEAGIRRLVAGEGNSFTQEKPNIRKDGSIVWISLSLSLVRDLQGQPDYLVAVVEDIQDRKNAEARLRASEERFSAIFLASPLAILFSRQEDQVVLDANPAFLDLSGLPLDGVLGRPAHELAFWDHPREHQRAREAIDVNGYLRNFEMTFRHASGRTGRARVSTEVVRLGEHCFLLELFQDITVVLAAEEKERQMAEELNHLQRLESVGRLAGGISHDMNNVLSAIMAMATLLQTQRGDPGELAHRAGVILQAATRGRDLVKGLTDFARKEVPDAHPLDLNALVRKEVELLEHTTFKRIQIASHLQEDLPEILGDRSALSNVLMNLCVNACDAMPQGGSLTLRTRRPHPDWVEVLVEDTGEGMSPEVAVRAMEPFFTTKPPGKGTGLGLSIVYGTVKAHGGTVDIHSAPGKGTSVRLGFPAATGEPAAPGRPAPGSPAQTMPLRILVVDDDDLILKTIGPLLELLGHSVQVASGGLEALRRLEAGLEVDLAILDLNMPGMGGEELLPRVRLLRPELPILISTGYLEPDQAHRFQAYSQVQVIGKPFLLEEFQAQVASLT